MKKTNKITSILLAMVMMLSFTPFTVFAAESDGVPTTIDVSEYSSVIVEDYYDPDGIILTGNNPDAVIDTSVDIEITFKDLTACHVICASGVKTVTTINLEGDNVMTAKYGFVFANDSSDVIINAKEDATLTATVDGYFISDNGWGGTLTVNGGNINMTSTDEDGDHQFVRAAYTQNGGNVTLSATVNNILHYGAVLNGGSLTVSNTSEYITNSNITIAEGAEFKATSETGIIRFDSSGFNIAESSSENLYLFAKTSADGEFVLIKDASPLNAAKYLELKVDTHEHSFPDSDVCICEAKKADYSGYYAAMARYEAIVDEHSDKFADSAKDYITAEVQKIVDKYLGNSVVKNNYTEKEQYILDGIADGVNEICDTLEKGVANGTLVKPDYTEIEAKIAEFQKTHSGEEYNALVAEIIADYNAMVAKNHKTAVDATGDIAAIEAKMNKTENCEHNCHKDGITGFFWKIVNFFSKLFGINPVCECGATHYNHASAPAEFVPVKNETTLENSEPESENQETTPENPEPESENQETTPENPELTPENQEIALENPEFVDANNEATNVLENGD